MRYEYDKILGFQDWRAKYPTTPSEIYMAYSFIEVFMQDEWFRKYRRFRWDGCRIKSFIIFKIKFTWGQDAILVDDEDENWVKYKKEYDDKNRKS